MAKKQQAQRPFVAGCRLDVREYGQTYIARAAGLNITASCTCGARAAAERCADKVFGSGNWELTESNREMFIASRKIRPEDLKPAKPAKLRSVWRDPADEMPDDEIEVVIRRRGDEYPVALGYREGGRWFMADCSSPECEADDSMTITGWLHLEEAAAIIDRATRGEVPNV